MRGPFTLSWGGNVLEDVEEIEFDLQTNSEEFETHAGNIFQIEGGIKAEVKVTLLSTDIPALAALLPQYFVPNGEILGDGTFVDNENGAIDLVPNDCSTDPIYNDLIITSCGETAESIKLIKARTLIDSIEIGKIRKVVVKLIGEPVAGESVIQVIGASQIEGDLFLLGDNDLFALGSGENLLL